MKFRVLEIKEGSSRIRFRPQYKSFLFWKNISEHYFAKTVYNHTEFLDWDCSSVLYINEAKAIIDEFKFYLKSKESYIITHNV